jgi:hypothetical protein
MWPKSSKPLETRWAFCCFFVIAGCGEEIRIDSVIITGKPKEVIMQDYICEACGKSAHSAGIAVLCVHCGGFLMCEQEAARKTMEAPVRLQAGRAS